MGELIEGALARRRGPRSLAEELDFLDAYGRPFPGGMLEALIQDDETGPSPSQRGHCEVIYWQFRVADGCR